MCDFVNSDKYTCEQVDEIGIPIIFYEDGDTNVNDCYEYDTKCFYELSHLIVSNIQTDVPKYFTIQLIKFFRGITQSVTIVGTFGTITISLNVDKVILKFEYDNIKERSEEDLENATLEIPISNFYIVFDIEHGINNLLDIYKEQYRKLNMFTYDLPNYGFIGEITDIKVQETTYGIRSQTFIPFSTF